MPSAYSIEPIPPSANSGPASKRARNGLFMVRALYVPPCASGNEPGALQPALLACKRGNLMPRRVAQSAAEVAIAGVRITHPDKLLWSADGITKLDLARYYERVGPTMLPYLRD